MLQIVQNLTKQKLKYFIKLKQTGKIRKIFKNFKKFIVKF